MYHPPDDLTGSVSPVIAVILMVAVTVALSTVVGVFVFELHEGVDGGAADAVQTDFSVESTSSQTVTVTNIDGSIETASLHMRVSAGGDSARIYPDGTTTGSLDVEAGDGALYTSDSWSAGETTSFRLNDAVADSGVSVAIVDENSETLLSEKETAINQDFHENCLAILNAGDSTGSGYYIIEPEGSNPFEVYCDMETDGGGWTLVASFADGSQLSAAGSDNDDDTIDWADRKSKRDKFLNPTIGDVDDATDTDTVVKSYETVEFDEQMFANERDEWVKYAMTGSNVADWFGTLEHGVDYESETANCGNNQCTTSTNEVFQPVDTNLDATAVNKCDTLEVRFLPEDSDNAVGHHYHGYAFGPSWQTANNNSCPWDDSGNKAASRHLGGSDNPQSDYIWWFVR